MCLLLILLLSLPSLFVFLLVAVRFFSAVLICPSPYLFLGIVSALKIARRLCWLSLSILAVNTCQSN